MKEKTWVCFVRARLVKMDSDFRFLLYNYCLFPYLVISATWFGFHFLLCFVQEGPLSLSLPATPPFLRRSKVNLLLFFFHGLQADSEGAQGPPERSSNLLQCRYNFLNPIPLLFAPFRLVSTPNFN